MVREILCEIGVAARAVSEPCSNMYKPRNPQEKLAERIKVNRTKYFFQQRKENVFPSIKRKSIEKDWKFRKTREIIDYIKERHI